MEISPIKHRYLLVLIIPVYQTDDGVRWLDHLWYKDLLEHIVYIEDFTLACPCIRVRVPPPNQVKVEDARIKFVDLPGKHKLTFNLPSCMLQLWRAVGNADVVHTGLGGWLPISICNVTAVMAKLRRRFLFIMVESSPWRIVPGSKASAVAKLKAKLAEWMNQRRLEQVDLAVFTQAKYKESLMVRRPQRGHIIHASWIDDAIIAAPHEAAKSWRDKLPDGHRELKFLFAGRVTAAKGVLVLLDALRELDQRGRAIELHVIGQGDLTDACRTLQGALTCARLQLLEPVYYGPKFFELLRGYHAVVVPSISDEQPRIVYDAYSQAIPVLASNTDGLRDCIEDKVTGRLCRPNDSGALAELLEWAASNPDKLRAMSVACLERARQMTHQQMHRRRWKLLDDNLRAFALKPAR